MASGGTDLVEVWGGLPLEHPPYALLADIDALGRRSEHTISLSSYKEYLSECLDKRKDRRLHLGVIPQPWFGELSSADVFVLMLNPGLNHDAYFSEYEVPAFRAALIDNLHQKPGREFPLLFLDPQFAWHSGARYFRARFEWLAAALVSSRGQPYREALSDIARRICVLQLVPYHSTAFGLSKRVLNRIASTVMVKTFVVEDVLPRSVVLVVATRKPDCWGIKEHLPKVVCYSNSETRAAHLSPR